MMANSPVGELFNPIVVWGLFPRALGFVYFIALASLFRQVLPFAGSRGLRPIKNQLQKIQKDFPSWKRLVYFPTLLWLNAEDAYLQGLVLVGILASLVVIYGGLFSSWALLVCWLVYLSLDLPMGLSYPWDSVLLEAGFLAIFLPSIHSLPDLTTTALPLAASTWAFRWLIFRVMFGFGKIKFFGTTRKESTFLKEYFIFQPIPNPISWYSYNLPGWLLKVGLLFLFVVEIPTPFLIFLGGNFRLAAAFLIVMLMIGIQVTSNFGFFNIVMIALCVVLLDRSASLFAISPGNLFYPLNNLIINIVVFITTVGGLVALPFNSWCSQAWLYWPSGLLLRSKWIQGLISFYRCLSPFRIVHSYGVFPPTSSPAVKWIPIVEGTNDGKTWNAYPYYFLPTSPLSPPRFVAPHHPRLEHKLFYEAYGLSESGYFKSTFSTGNPYTFSHVSEFHCLMQHLLEGNSLVVRLFRSNPFPDAPPKAVRITLYMFVPTTPAEHAQTGHWWHQTYIGQHLPATTLDDRVWTQIFPEPEHFHWDDILWKQRSPRIKMLMDVSKATRELYPSCLADEPPGDNVTRFWQDFSQFVGKADNRDWKRLTEVVAQVQVRYGFEQLRRFEKMVGQLGLILYAVIEPYYVGDSLPRVEVPTFFHMQLLIYHVIGEGRETYENLLENPSSIVTFARHENYESGLYYLGIFWHDTFDYHARKIRLAQTMGEVEHIIGLPGFPAFAPFLAKQFDTGAEHLPVFIRMITDGEWKIVDRNDISLATDDGL